MVNLHIVAQPLHALDAVAVLGHVEQDAVVLVGEIAEETRGQLHRDRCRAGAVAHIDPVLLAALPLIRRRRRRGYRRRELLYLLVRLGQLLLQLQHLHQDGKRQEHHPMIRYHRSRTSLTRPLQSA